MKSVIELGKQGGDQLEVATPAGITEDQALRDMIAVLRRFKLSTVPAETADGLKRDVDVRVLPLASPKVFGLAHRLAAYEPMLYAKVGQRRALGMMSPNYQTDGSQRLPSLKIIPLQTAYPLTTQFKPDAEMATMLAGAVSAERAGVGSDREAGKDFEHQATILGAISLRDPSVALSHQNHEVRAGGSAVATGLTNGQLGNLYTPSTEIGNFTGFGEPLVIGTSNIRQDDVLMIPDSFLDSPEAWGGTYDDAARIMLGAGWRALQERQGANAVTLQFRSLTESV